MLLLFLVPDTDLCELALNQTLGTVSGTPNLDNLQVGLVQESLPVLTGALAGAQESHHHDIQARGLPLGAGVWDDILIDEELAVAGLHGSGDVSKDLEADLLGPVVEDRVHEVCAGLCNYQSANVSLCDYFT